MMKNSRLVLCRNCVDWKQLQNPEQGKCWKGAVTNYDTRCLYGLTEIVNLPKDIDIEKSMWHNRNFFEKLKE